MQRGSRWRRIAPVAVTALALALVATDASAGYASATFDAPYLSGVSGPRPSRSVDLAGTWNFQTVQTTTCSTPTVPVGPLPCTNTPASGRATIQVPGGGWIKQGFTNVS